MSSKATDVRCERHHVALSKDDAARAGKVLCHPLGIDPQPHNHQKQLLETALRMNEHRRYNFGFQKALAAALIVLAHGSQRAARMLCDEGGTRHDLGTI